VMRGFEPWDSATAARPSEVEMPIGMPNQARPPSRKALVLVSGREATARCQ
jgi:hypothetical protein